MINERRIQNFFAVCYNEHKRMSLHLPKEKKQWSNKCNEITSHRGWYDNEHLKMEKE
jgi:hypothetical protein